MTPKMTIALIAAMTEARVIGLNNKMPWHLSEDLKHFKATTMGCPIIMGRKTFESFGSRALPGRRNIIISHNAKYDAPGAEVFTSLEQALDNCRAAKTPKIFIIGGQTLFTAALPMADELYLTMIHHDFPGDTWFPEFDLKKDFSIESQSTHRSSTTPSFGYTFIHAIKKRTKI